MNNQDIISEELAAVAPFLNTVNRNNIYSVPFDYFDSIAKNVGEFIKQNDVTTANSSKINVFGIPVGYFDSLPLQVLQKIAAENNKVDVEIEQELLSIAPGLTTINRHNVYSLPAGYFEGLSFKPETAKVVSFNKFRRFKKYAAAAIITGILVISSAIFFNVDKTETSLNPIAEFNVQEFQTLSEEDIATYLETHSAAGDVAITLSTEPANTETNEEQILNETTDEEIQEFLKENPVIVPKGTDS